MFLFRLYLWYEDEINIILMLLECSFESKSILLFEGYFFMSGSQAKHRLACFRGLNYKEF